MFNRVNPPLSPGQPVSSSASSSSSSWYSSSGNQKVDPASVSMLSDDGMDMNSENATYVDDDLDNELPLLEELGISKFPN